MDYGQLTTMLKTVAANHLSVAYADAGYVEDLNWGENNYPMVMFVCQPGTFEVNRINYNMSMICADIMDDDALQQIPKQSNMFNVGRDIINYLLNQGTTATSTYELVEESVVFTPFTDNLPDLCTGFQFDFQIYVRNYNNCNLPFGN